MESYRDPQPMLEAFMGGAMVKFQPKPSFQLTYPCLIYHYTGGRSEHSNNYTYLYQRRYTVTIITRDGTSDLPDRFVKAFPLCSHDRSYIADNLYHHVFTLYY